MKKILLLLVVFIVTNCKAQQKELDSLLNELKKHPQEDSIRYNLLKTASSYYGYIDPQKGVEIADAAIVLAKKLNSETKIAGALVNKANNLHKLGNDSDAFRLYEQAVTIDQNNGNVRGAANALYNMGRNCLEISDYPKSIKYLQRAVELYSQLSLRVDIADCYNTVGDNYLELDNYYLALLNFMKALPIYQQEKVLQSEAMVLSNIGLIYHNLHNSSKALEYYQKAVLLNEKTGNKSNLANDDEYIGNIYADQHDLKQAMQFYNKALIINTSLHDEREIAGNLSNIGVVYRELKNYNRAYYYIDSAIKIYKILTDKYDMAIQLNQLGKLYIGVPGNILPQLVGKVTNRYSKAITYQSDALRLAQDIKAVSLQADILGDISDTYAKQKNFSKALEMYKQSVVLSDSILTNKKRDEITRLELQYEFNRQQDSVRSVNDKQQALAKAEIQQQRITKNATLTGAGFLFLAGISGFVFYKRNRDIRFMKQISDTELKALRAQMNPHFIFNSLNSISDFMIKNNTQKADEYLTKFAKLMRLILENSEQKEVSLTDDLKALELYMQLEALRMQNKFTYDIQVADDIDKDNTLIPPLILQPFVENSIWHGLTKKNGEGRIIIQIRKENNMLLCTVEDNGIGREEAKAYKEEMKINNKKSVGLRITNARIDIINKLKNTNATIELSDLAEGTKAEVRLPLELSF